MSSTQSRPTKPAIHLVMMPSFAGGGSILPHLGIASLSAYLKREGLGVTCTDFRSILKDAPVLTDDGDIGSNYIYRDTAYVSEIQDLPLILFIVNNYRENSPLLLGLDQALLDYIEIRSLNYFQLKDGIERAFKTLSHYAPEMADHGTVGFTTVSSNLFYTVLFSLMLRRHQPRIKLIYGGPQVTLSMHTARLMLKLGIANLVVAGDGEETLLTAVEAYARKSDPSLDGTITWEEGRGTFVDKPLKRVPDLSSLPDPDFSGFHLPSYLRGSLPLEGSRGCASRCKFCSYGRLSPYRTKDPVRVVDSMERLGAEYKAINFSFSDSTINQNPKWLGRIAQELIRRKRGFHWSGFFKPPVSGDLLSTLRKSGLNVAYIGAESLSDEQLTRMGRRGTTGEAILDTIEAFCSAGILVVAGVIIGFPGESNLDFRTTCGRLYDLLKKYPRTLYVSPRMFGLRPSSACYENPSDHSITVEHWDSKVAGILPEVEDLVRAIPMSFRLETPGARDAVDRYIFMQNVTNRIDRLKARGPGGKWAYYLQQLARGSFSDIIQRILMTLNSLVQRIKRRIQKLW